MAVRFHCSHVVALISSCCRTFPVPLSEDLVVAESSWSHLLSLVFGTPSRRKRMLQAGTVSAERLEVRSMLTAGALDTTFDTDGIVTTSITSGGDIATGVAVQADGRIVAVGNAYALSNTDADFTVTRYLSNGSLDTSFGTAGIVTTSIGSGFDEAFDVAIQGDGKIVVAGRTNSSGTYQFAVARYNVNGSLDTSFDGDGIATTSVGGIQDIGTSLALSADGKIVVAGWSLNGSNQDFALVRFNSDGSLDSTLDGDGKVTSDFGSSESASDVEIQADGRIVLAGFGGVGFLLARYNPDGTLDSTFDGDGVAQTASEIFGGAADAIEIQADGKIVAAGATFNGVDSDFAVARYNVDGTLDPSFGGDGVVVTGGLGPNETASAVAIQDDGRIVVGGVFRDASSGNEQDFMLVRYDSNGSLDPTFDGDGQVFTTISIQPDFLRDIAIQADGKIVAVGGDGTSTGDNYVVRYEGDFVPPSPSFAIKPQDDVPQVFLEGNSGRTAYQYVVTRSGDLSQPVSVRYAVSAASSGLNAADFSGGPLPSGLLVFPAGVSSLPVVVQVKGDRSVEADEQFRVTLSNASAGMEITTPSASGTIISDDASISIEALDEELAEGNSGSTVFRFAVTRVGGVSASATVPFHVTGHSGHAANRFDFGGQLPSGVVTFAPGETTQMILISVSGDLVVEDDESFAVHLTSPPAGHMYSNQMAKSKILNDDDCSSGSGSSSGWIGVLGIRDSDIDSLFADPFNGAY